MNERLLAFKEKYKSILNFITDKKTVKGARITYQVIWNLFLVFLTIVIIGTAFSVGLGAGYFASLVKDEPIRSYSSMKKDIYDYSETSNLYFANGVYLGKLRSDLEREEVKLNQISDYLVKAVIATEDGYFYQHKGVVPKSIFRALFQEVTNSSVQTGGSTLTQQLIKNQILTNEVSFQRKASEILLALRLEKFFTKKQILEAYLNVSTFGRNSSGRNIAGVQAAAKGIFGKNASQLTLPEAAFIAGLPQSPFGYTPFTNEGKLKNDLQPGIQRMKTVLKRMVDGKYITESQYKTAVVYDITKDFAPHGVNPVESYPWLTFEIEKRSIDVLATVLAEKDGISEKELKKNDKLYNNYLTLANRDLHQKGYEIHTTIDKGIYDAMQKAKNQYPYYGPDKPQIVKDPDTGQKITVMEPVQVGAMLIENKTGKIVSFVGGRDYNEQQLNHATSSIRQNGSTMKPLLVYGPAIEAGKAFPGTPLPDVALKLNPANPSNPWPHNYDLKYSGIVSARDALTKSINVPAVKLYKDIQPLKPIKYLEKMGFSSLVNDDYSNLATAIGSLRNGVTVEENTNAYSTFANGGKFIDAYLVDKIVDKNGKVIYQHKVKPETVFTPQTAYLTLDMMRDVVKRGTAAGINSRLKFKTDWAGKTGTGNEYIDSWFVASNPNVTFGIWTGYDTPKSLQAKGNLTYSQRTNYLWVDLINAAYGINPNLIAPKESFSMPSGIVKRSYCSVSGMLPSVACTKAGLIQSDYFNAKYVPTQTDDSLIDGKYVQLGDKKYLAMDTTPDDFAQEGVILNPDFIKRIVGNNFTDYTQLIPKKDSWSKILVPNAKLSENGKIPAAPTISVNDKTITWTSVSESDVIGYRVYKVDPIATKAASIKTGSSLSYTGGTGTYYVTTVDIAGNESSPSNEIQIGPSNSQAVSGH
ncbi:MAG: transglycosylase domain-containing protein [Bacillota bacterium]|nr:transglycosylase domain-containing protein [Bacillota bacterium]